MQQVKRKQIVLMGAATPVGHYILVNSLLLGFEVVAITPIANKINVRNKNLKVLESNLQNLETIRSIVNNSEVIINAGCPGLSRIKSNFFM